MNGTTDPGFELLGPLPDDAQPRNEPCLPYPGGPGYESVGGWRRLLVEVLAPSRGLLRIVLVSVDAAGKVRDASDAVLRMRTPAEPLGSVLQSLQTLLGRWDEEGRFAGTLWIRTGTGEGTAGDDLPRPIAADAPEARALATLAQEVATRAAARSDAPGDS